MNRRKHRFSVTKITFLSLEDMPVSGLYLDFLTSGGWSQCQGVADQTNFAKCAIVGLRTTLNQINLFVTTKHTQVQNNYDNV